MIRRTRPPDVGSVLRGLKDFQRDTVDYVFRRLFLDANGTRRFLIADEVGLGKTLVAKGVVARAIAHLWSKVRRIDVIYICSNSSIARQNINRLNVTGQEQFEIASRITLLPVTIRDLKKRRLNFISFTPGTSFDLRSSLGTAEERALLYWLLDQAWGLHGTGPLNVLQGNADKNSFRARVSAFRDDYEIDESLAREFSKSLKLHIAADHDKDRPDIKHRFCQLCRRFRRTRKNIPFEDSHDRKLLVGELRSLLATTCLSALQPDLIILDEFQRFRHLLDGTDRASDLARGFFEHPEVRILLLSATPYKMLTLQRDHDQGDNHHRDFLQTISFLQQSRTESAKLETLLAEYGTEIYRVKRDGPSRLRGLANRVKGVLRQVIVRTERLGASEDRNGMLALVPSDHLSLEPREAAAYLSLQGLARAMHQGDTIEYWKSAPYLLNFMDDYELKVAFREALGTRIERTLRKILKESEGVILSAEDVAAYRRIDPNNARLRSMVRDVIDNGSWKTLWIPPCLPYHELTGPFAEPALKGFTKRLVFSAWRVVPRVVSALLSYEVERRAFTAFEKRPRNEPKSQERRRRPLLRFSYNKNRLTGMPVLGLIYPSPTLAMEFDPFATLVHHGVGGETRPISSLIDEMRRKIDRKLKTIGAYRIQTGPTDETWYWAAPMLLDLREDKAMTQRWFDQPGLAQTWAGSEDDDDGTGHRTHWENHVDAAKRFLEARPPKLGRPPKDLSLVLAQMALAAPSTVALRSMSRVCGGWLKTKSGPSRLALRTAAAQIGWAFLRLFNTPTATALIRSMNGTEPYWQRALEYCVSGCLQATMDEYAHLLLESLGVAGKKPAEVAAEVSRAVCDAISLRSSTLGADYIDVRGRKIRTDEDGPGFRCHFAVRFGDEKSEEERNLVRAGRVREAFNSPFWPFVLATTSVGQEGLDFHPYCHAVVHWNLPPNPVDLEQREGRVHRYKGHAVRKNLAAKYGGSAPSNPTTDPWEQMFRAGVEGRQKTESDLVPFWILDIPGGAKIERHVPAFPLSRDLDKLERLRRSLAVYRMVFGQTRQEDLLAFLLDHFNEGEPARLVDKLQIDLSPPPAP
ncbi:MAG: hypothetical protein IT578_00780 [Verrucomicrobiae bacterium]|nr:hypothetical protein [Verrucomicrobiae bacterium]